MRSRAGSHAITVLMLLAIWPATAQTPAGEPFTVNTTTDGFQTGPDVAAAPDGVFAVVWQDEVQDGDGWGLYARWFDATGEALTGEVQVNRLTAGDQLHPQIDSDGQGNFVIAWLDLTFGVRARRFDGVGMALGDELAVTPPGPGPADQSVSANAAGSFVVTWLRPDLSNRVVEARRYGADGLPLGKPFTVSTFPQFLWLDGTEVELLDDLSFVVAWSDGEEVSARLYDSNGSPAGAEFQVSQGYPYSSFSSYVDVGSEASGRFRVVWTTDVNLLEVTTMTRTITGGGALGPLTDLDLRSPEYDVSGFSMTRGGEFVVTQVSYWPRTFQGTRFDANHNPLSQFEVAGDADDSLGGANVAHQSADSQEFVVVWAENPPGGFVPDIRARCFSPRIFSDGFESGDTAAWSTTVP